MDPPVVGSLSLMKNSATDRVIKVVRNGSQVLEFVMGVEEAAKRPFATARLVPSIAKRFQCFDHQAAHRKDREAVPLLVVESRIQITFVEPELNHIGDLGAVLSGV